MRIAAALLTLATVQPVSATVKQGIEMTMVGSPLDLSPSPWPALTSPDGERDALVVYAGDVENDMIRYRLLIFDRQRTGRIAPPKQLIAISSNAALNSPGITQLKWDGSRHLLALVAPGNNAPSLIRIDVETGVFETVVTAPSTIVDYALASDSRSTVTMEHREARPDHSVRATYAGRVIGEETPYALLSTRDELANYHGFGGGNIVKVRHARGASIIELPSSESPLAGMGLSVSPSGRFVLIPVTVQRAVMPAHWEQSTIPKLWVYFYGIRMFDQKTHRLTWLVDEPTSWQPGPSARWSSDETKVLVYNLATKLAAGNGGPAAGLVDVSAGRVIARFPGEFRPERDGQAFADLSLRELSANNVFHLRNQGNKWSLIHVDAAAPAVRLSEAMNSPPVLVEHNFATGSERLLLDLNPQLSMLREAQVREYSWNRSKGVRATVGLYLPHDYRPGVRYPLVIQTHGWSNSHFWYDGPSSAGFAARSLAEQGFVVAQMGGQPIDGDPADAGAAGTELIDELIANLDRDGFVDPKRLGITAWSSTGYGVRHALAFSRYHFGAAVLVDSRDGGFMSYLLSTTTIQDAMDLDTGGMPYGYGLNNWRQRSPMFNIDRVRTPVRLVKLGPQLLGQWEQWASMRRLKKPIEFIWIPEANHWPILPSERMEVQQGAVDWYRYWLQNDVDPVAMKTAQYQRWAALRSLNHLSNQTLVGDPLPVAHPSLRINQGK